MKNQKSFVEWKKEVDKEVEKQCGMSVDDLPDCCFHDWYEDNVSPKSAAMLAIKNAE